MLTPLSGKTPEQIVEMIDMEGLDYSELLDLSAQLEALLKRRRPMIGRYRKTPAERVANHLRGRPSGRTRSQTMLGLRLSASEMDAAIEEGGQSEFWVVNYWNAGKRAQRLFAKEYQENAEEFWQSTKETQDD